jgi:hypothetical protein
MGGKVFAADEILSKFDQVLGPHSRHMKRRENVFPGLLRLELERLW